EGRLGPVNSEQIDYLQSAIESCEEVVTMIDNLLDMQRYNSGRMNIRITNVDPLSILADAVRRFFPAAERENILLTLTAESSTSEIAVDISIMARVIANLVGNALKFTPEGGFITISCRSIKQSELHCIERPHYAVLPNVFPVPESYALISVSDNGNGISPAELTCIFERYVQAGNSSRRGQGGAGLGLAFCKKAVEDFNGCIWAESVEDSGSKFFILIPCHVADASYTNQMPEPCS
ncbi:MAG: HAMP domain-containing sensor histidine kinase, partial [Desulfuromonadales bacterium]